MTTSPCFLLLRSIYWRGFSHTPEEYLGYDTPALGRTWHPLFHRFQTALWNLTDILYIQSALNFIVSFFIFTGTLRNPLSYVFSILLLQETRHSVSDYWSYCWKISGPTWNHVNLRAAVTRFSLPFFKTQKNPCELRQNTWNFQYPTLTELRKSALYIDSCTGHRFIGIYQVTWTII